MTQELSNEELFSNYLKSINFEKHLNKLSKKFKNKSVVIYGTGLFFQVIHKVYDLKKINIVALSDKKFENHTEGETFLNYKVISPQEIRAINPDIVFVATKFFVNIIENLNYNVLQGTKIKIKPLINKPFFELIKEIWQ
jgi:ABC-type Fe3+-hydroxamate transport system substrate-binding protein